MISSDKQEDFILFLYLYIAIFITLVLPIAGILGVSYLKRNQTQTNKIIAYFIIIAMLWLSVALVLSIYSFSDLIYISPISYSIKIKIIILTSFVLYIFVTSFLPLILLRKEKYSLIIKDEFNKKGYINPTTKKEIYYFFFVAITVGICEEILFRSFLYTSFTTSHFFDNPHIILLIVNVIFGLVHFLQGYTGMLSNFLLGVCLSYIFLVTGNLVISIIIHILIDLKLVYISRKLSKVY